MQRHDGQLVSMSGPRAVMYIWCMQYPVYHCNATLSDQYATRFDKTFRKRLDISTCVVTICSRLSFCDCRNCWKNIEKPLLEIVEWVFWVSGLHRLLSFTAFWKVQAEESFFAIHARSCFLLPFSRLCLFSPVRSLAVLDQKTEWKFLWNGFGKEDRRFIDRDPTLLTCHAFVASCVYVCFIMLFCARVVLRACARHWLCGHISPYAKWITAFSSRLYFVLSLSFLLCIFSSAIIIITNMC